MNPMSQQEERYRGRTAASQRYFQEACRYMPGSDSRSTLFYPPYPAVFDRGEGCHLYDLDGNRLLDFTGNHSSLVHGYGAPRVMEEVQRQLQRGTCFPGATEPQLRLARLLCERIRSLDHVRFTNSGTEATMNALRAARAFTGRPRVAKIEGGYNGSFDGAMISTHPAPSDAGDALRPIASPSSLGLPRDALRDLVVLPFNEVEAAARRIEEEADQLAAVIVEPVMGSAGMIPADRDYLEMLREVTERHGIVLIFDEVVSFRVARGGAQEYFGISPDLTCLGKLIGGGFPLGAFGGRHDVMAMFDPSKGRPRIPHPGSYNANPISMVAGAATLELLTPEAIASLNQKGDLLRTLLRQEFAAAGVPAQVTGLGSLFGIHLVAGAVRGYRDTLAGDFHLRHRLFLGLYDQGVLIDPRGAGTISTAISEAEIQGFASALRAVLASLRASGPDAPAAPAPRALAARPLA